MESTLYWDIGWHSVFLASCTETFSHALPTPSPLPSFLACPSVLWRRDRNIQIQHTVGLISYFPTSRDLCVCECDYMHVASCAIECRVALIHLRPDVLLLSVERYCTADHSTVQTHTIGFTCTSKGYKLQESWKKTICFSKTRDLRIVL